MDDQGIVAPLLAIATGALAEADLQAAWQRWRSMRPDLGDVGAAEVVVLPAAWGRARAAGVGDPDAARLEGLQRKAALTTAVTLARVSSAQAALRDASLDSAVAGGPAVVLLGAATPEQRSVRSVDLWVARSDFAAALKVLGARADGRRYSPRVAVTGGAALPAYPGVVLRSRLPTLPPIDGRALVAARRRIHWSGKEVEVLGPTEAVFVASVLHSARRLVARARRWPARGEVPEVAAVVVGQELDRRLIERLGDFDAASLHQLCRVAGRGVGRGPTFKGRRPTA